TSFSRDWSSDVCSSDLKRAQITILLVMRSLVLHGCTEVNFNLGCNFLADNIGDGDVVVSQRDEEVGFDRHDAALDGNFAANYSQIGRASCRERVWVAGV